MNIYQRICPECATASSLDTISCGCGYSFDPEASANCDPTEYAQQQDRLYRDYLAARIAQAEAELAVARERANADPGSAYNASSALLAEQALHALQAEINQLNLKIPATAPARIKTADSQPSRTAPAKALAAHRATVAPSVAPNIASKIPAQPKAPAPRFEPPARQKPPPPVAAQTRPRSSPTVRSPMMRAPMNGVKVALDLARKLVGSSPVKATPRVSPRRVSVAPAAAAPVNGQRHPAVPSVGTRPDENFRRLQAKKAESIARSNRVATAPQSARSVIKPAPQPAPADIPPLTLRTQNTTQECPNCTATVAANSTRCSCGYTLARPGEEVPAITLDATALAILTEGISFNSSNRRR